MAHRNDTPRRKEVEAKLARNASDLDEKTKNLIGCVEDHEKIGQLRDALSGDGTAEGLEDVVQQVDHASESAEDLAKQSDEKLEAVHEAETVFARDIEERGEHVGRDCQEIRDASCRLLSQELKNKLEKVGEVSHRDAEYLHRIASDARSDLAQNQNIRQALLSRIRGGR